MAPNRRWPPPGKNKKHRVRPFGESDADALLAGIGMSEQEIAALRGDGVVE